MVVMGSITRKEKEREIRDHAILSSRLSIPLVISSNMIDPLTQTHRSPKFVRKKTWAVSGCVSCRLSPYYCMITTYTSSSCPVCARGPYTEPFASFLRISQEQYTGSEFVFLLEFYD